MMSVINSSFPALSSGDNQSERLSDIIIPPSDYQHPSNYLDPNPRPVKRESPSRPTQEHDSGVVVDRDSDHFSRQASQVSPTSCPPEQFSPHNTENMPIKRRPESLAVRGHEYEELPTSRQQSVDFSSSGDQFPGSRQGPPMFTKLNSVQSSHTGSNDHLLFNGAPPLPVYRKRQNPLYDSNDHEDEDSDVISKKSPAKQSCACLCPCLFMVVLVSLISLCLSLYTFTRIYWHADKPITANLISPHNHSAEGIVQHIQLLEKQNSLLEKKVKSLEAVVKALEANSSSQFTLLQEIKFNMEYYQENSDSKFIQLTSHVQNVTKMEGPKGPSGSGNLSQCVHSKKSAGGSAFDPYTETGPVPSDHSQYMDEVILGVECTTEGGEKALLRVLNDQSFVQYVCRCSGKDSHTTTSRQCEMHYWSCPKIS